MSIKLFTLEDKNQFIENIRIIRLERNFSIEKLGKFSGMSKNTICSWLNNLSEPLTPSLLHFAQTLISLDIPIENIFYNIKITPLGKNILTVCSKCNVSIKKLSEDLNVKEEAVYSWINGLCKPSFPSLVQLAKTFITLNIPLEDVFIDTDITPLGICFFKLCAKNNINLKDFCYVLDLNLNLVTSWIYGTATPAKLDWLYLTKCFIILDFPLEDILISSELSPLGEDIRNLCITNNIYLTDLCKFLDIDIVCNWLYSKSKPRIANLLCIAQSIVFLNLPLENTLINFKITPLGKNILQLCANANISILELSTQLNVSVYIIHKWIQGKIIPTQKTLISIAKILNISIDDLLYNIEKTNETIFKLFDGIISVSKIAELCGVSRKTVYNWKYNATTPSTHTLEYILDYISTKN